MAAEVENMFYVRETPWHGLGTEVQEAPDSREALRLAGLDWSLLGGRKVWMLARMPHEYIISGERISPYLLFSNTHDGSGAVRVALTPIRVVCSNTLNLALATARRSWSMIHTGDIRSRMKEAEDTLFLAEQYMDSLGKEFEALRKKKLSDRQVMEYIEILLPMEDGSTPQQEKNIWRMREDMKMRYFDAPNHCLQKLYIGKRTVEPRRNPQFNRKRPRISTSNYSGK